MTAVHATRAVLLAVSAASGKRVKAVSVTQSDYNHNMPKANDKLVPMANP